MIKINLEELEESIINISEIRNTDIIHVIDNTNIIKGVIIKDDTYWIYIASTISIEHDRSIRNLINKYIRPNNYSLIIVNR